jgi:DNA/RNA endonuclease G (NUC1)
MTEIETASSRFSSLEELRTQHDKLLARAESEDQSLSSVPYDAIADFLARAAATGTVISNARERREAHRILSFWTAELITRRGRGADWSAPRLAEAKPAEIAAESMQASRQSQQPQPSDDELARSRALVRISAGARQWRARDRDPGWLLTGDALREAEKFVGDDEDIRELVAASRDAELKFSRQRRKVLGAAVAVLVALCAWLGYALWAATIANRAKDVALDAANRANRAKDAALQTATAERREVEAQSAQTREADARYQNALTEQALRTDAQQEQLGRLQRSLQEIAETLHRLRNEGKITDADVPEVLRPFVAALDQQPPPAAPLTGLNEFARGYDPAFLQSPVGASQDAPRATIVIPLPRLSEAARASAFNEGRPIDYVNFGIVLNQVRRTAILSAVNLRRSAVVPLLRPPDAFRYDVRVPRDAQLPPNSFARNDFDRGHLVNAREIAWGPAFGADPIAAGQRAFSLVNLSPNMAPQYDTFNRGLWARLERYAQLGFSAQSDRVTIFSGPVLAANDPIVDGVAIPRLFWKVLAATRPDNPASLIVEAYLVSQFDERGAKTPLTTEFAPDLFRIRVSDIERLTGLDFGETVRAADSGWRAPPIQNATQAATRGDDLVARLQTVVGADRAERMAAMQQLLNALRDQTLAERDLRRLVEGIVALVNAGSFRELSPEARVNVLTLLTAVPEKQWDGDRWIDLKAAARRAVADASVILGGCSNASQACEQIGILKANLDWGLASDRTVYVQFAGMVREDVRALSEKLKILGWTVPGEERIATAAGLNEVRYGSDPADQKAGEMLAADLRALGRSSVRAKRVNVIKTSVLEVWISI